MVLNNIDRSCPPPTLRDPTQILFSKSLFSVFPPLRLQISPVPFSFREYSSITWGGGGGVSEVLPLQKKGGGVRFRVDLLEVLSTRGAHKVSTV